MAVRENRRRGTYASALSHLTLWAKLAETYLLSEPRAAFLILEDDIEVDAAAVWLRVSSL